MPQENKDLTVKFPEDQPPTGQAAAGTVLTTTPNNPVDKAADFLPRALSSIKENFREATFLFSMLGYVFIAAFGHMERIQNYIGFFTVLFVSTTAYKIWGKVSSRDFMYIVIIAILMVYILSITFNFSLKDWL